MQMIFAAAVHEQQPAGMKGRLLSCLGKMELSNNRR